MALKIKWNDDRVRYATTALLLNVRARLQRDETARLIESAISDFRNDPAGYKINKATWPEPQETTPLTVSQHIAYYRNLLRAVDQLHQALTHSKRQFNSVLELDNLLITKLQDLC